jgi:predicted nuclease of predicted toxin-antitoxin system
MAVSMYHEGNAMTDDQAMKEDRTLITNDTDFGQKVYRDRRPHHGVILLRLEEEPPVSKIVVLSCLRDLYAAALPGSFVVLSEQRVRFARA